MSTRTRNTKLKKNSRGWFPKEVGFLDRAKRKQPKFNLGKDEKEAAKRLARIQELFDDCQRYTGLPIWTTFGLYAAKLLARGVYQIPLPFDRDEQEIVHDQESLEDICANYVQMIRAEQACYPSIQIVPTDDDAYAYGVRLNASYEQAVLERKEREFKEEGVISSGKKYPDKYVSGSLHDAFDRYVSHIKKSENKLDAETLKPAQRKRIEYVDVLKLHHRDCSLMELSSYDAIAEMIGYWANRPEYKKGKRYKPTTARHRRKELERFLRWLDLTSEFDWEMPRGANQIKVRTVELEEDHESADLLTKIVYTPEQLGIIAGQANEFERMLLLVGVNCAFGAAEIGRLITNEVLLHQCHKYAERLQFKSTGSDSFVRLMRPKSKMFGEWILWKETAEILDWAISRANQIGTPFLLVTKSGDRIYNEKLKNPQAATANCWRKLVKRSQKTHPELPFLPYGSLRDTLPDTLRHRGEDTLASICLAHKTAFKADNLLEAYGNKPFGRLHDAIRDLRGQFKPMLDAVRK
ncbi:hypothetical protein [Rhodopirellula sp. SWK7]|uniref:hypothetical protein n=1 Tax=Rhodopirellula sp. SWK7 TaxID=595460 RepID=UPI0002BD5366|nr:hypothetical protein [Rhodopirellula sp. SWK7]EMI41642.1 hypothetical protein RRSWK_05858 [Rhodopirellula sp. SWK7]